MGRTQTLFPTTPKVAKHDTTNRGGFPAYSGSLEENYLQMLLTNTLGNTFYTNAMKHRVEADDLHEEMIAKDANFAAKALAFARQEGYMRLQPIYGLAKLACLNTVAFEKAFPHVVLIPSDLADFLTILSSLRDGSQGGRAVKRVGSKFLGNVSEYWAIKYNGQGRGYSLGDMVATLHPKPKDSVQSALFGYLLGKDVNLSALPQLTAYEKLKAAKTEKEQIALITEGRLPHEVVTAVVKNPSKNIWWAIMKQMPDFALLRNLETLTRAGIFSKPEAYDFVRSKLTRDGALKRVLPFQVLKAYNTVKDAQLRDILREAMEKTFSNLPDVQGRTAIFLDISGSMRGEPLLTGGIFGFALYKKTAGNSLFWLFDDKVEDARPSRVDSILTQSERLHGRGWTGTSLPVEKMTAEKIKVDNIVVITDGQQNRGIPFSQALAKYRDAVNRDAKAFIVNIAPEQGQLVAEKSKNSWNIYGWSDEILAFITFGAKGYGNMATYIKNEYKMGEAA